jgi:hypothetical protein
MSVNTVEMAASGTRMLEANLTCAQVLGAAGRRMARWAAASPRVAPPRGAWGR